MGIWGYEKSKRCVTPQKLVMSTKRYPQVLIEYKAPNSCFGKISALQSFPRGLPIDTVLDTGSSLFGTSVLYLGMLKRRKTTANLVLVFQSRLGLFSCCSLIYPYIPDLLFCAYEGSCNQVCRKKIKIKLYIFPNCIVH